MNYSPKWITPDEKYLALEIRYKKLLDITCNEPIDLTWKIMSDNDIHACLLRYRETNNFRLLKAENAKLFRMFLKEIGESE
jgi:hypothetical protein